MLRERQGEEQRATWLAIPGLVLPMLATATLVLGVLAATAGLETRTRLVLAG